MRPLGSGWSGCPRAQGRPRGEEGDWGGGGDAVSRLFKEAMATAPAVMGPQLVGLIVLLFWGDCGLQPRLWTGSGY